MSDQGFIAPDVVDLSRWLEGYEVIELVACGGTGAVYRARQVSLDRIVALKVLPPEIAANDEFRAGFEAEAKAMARLTHSNLIRIFDFGPVEDMLYLVMEFVEGNTLYQSCCGQMVDPVAAIGLVKAVALGLGEAHGQGIVHRDIRPANILITPELVPKLSDFVLAASDAEVESGLVTGMPAYLAPEVLVDPHAAGFSSDTYALGVILYELLTGQSVEGGQPVDLALVPTQRGLRDLVQRATSESIAMRFQSGDEMAEELGKWEKSQEGAPVPSGVAQPAPARSVVLQSSGKAGLIVAPLVVAVVVVAILILLKGQSGPPDAAAGGGDQSGGAWIPEAVPTEAAASPMDAHGEDVEKPPPSADKAADPTVSAKFDKLRREQRVLVLGEIIKLRGRRLANRDEFKSAVGNRAEALLAGVSEELGDLPRYLQRGEVSLSGDLAEQLSEYAHRQQQQADRWFRDRLVALHESALGDFPAEPVELAKELRAAPEAWLEWLGLNPLEVCCRSLCGEWIETAGAEGPRFIVKSNGKANWLSEAGEPGAVAQLEIADDGRITLGAANGGDREWTLRWRNEELVGTDDRGTSCRFRLQPFDFHSLVGGSGSGDAGMEETVDIDINDPGVLALHMKYLETLKERIEPLEEGYLRVLAKADQLYASRRDKISQERIAREVTWVKALPWREGMLVTVLLPEPTDVPVPQDPQQQIFLTNFRQRYDETRKLYVTGLKQLKSERERGGQPVDEIDSQLKVLDLDSELDPGLVVARFVKLVSHEAKGIQYAAITEFEVLDRDGDALPTDAYGPTSCSSYEPGGKRGAKFRAAHFAFDGDSSTQWHTRWQDGFQPFPHWIAVDLKQARIISGFRILPRQKHWNRHVDIVKWTFCVSADGENWREVAMGTFPKGPAWRECRTLEAE